MRPSYRRFFANGSGCVAIFSNQPDSRARGLARCAANAAGSVFTAFPLAQRPSQQPAKAEFTLPMLPGFRFLLAAIILATSILIFGLGAAALLRAAHEEFASNPTWRAPPETIFAQQSEPTKPVLAALVVEPQPAEPRTPETLVTTAREAPATIAPPPEEPNEIAAPKAEPASPSETTQETAKSETPAETPASSERGSVQANATAGAPETETKITAIDKIAAILETPPPASDAAPAAPGQASAPAASEIDTTQTTIATLGGPPVAVDAPASPTLDKAAIKKQRLRARRARERRRLAAIRRAQLAQQAALQPATDLFGRTIPVATQSSPITQARATTQVRPITQARPITRVRPTPQARPTTQASPITQVGPLTQAR